MARVVIRSPYDCQSDGEKSVSPSRQGLASRHLLIATGACQPELKRFSFSIVIVNDPTTTSTSVPHKRTAVRKSRPALQAVSKLPLLVRFEVKRALDFNESAIERGGAIVSIVIRLLLDGSVVVCLAKGASVRGVVLT